MANLYNRGLTPSQFSKYETSTISIQMHITSRCDLKCKHCYMYSEEFELEDCKLENYLLFLKQVKDYCISNKKKCFIALTGGDPILSDHFWDLLYYLNNNRCIFYYVIMGNAIHITENIANKLKELNVLGYQLSLDGLKKLHDENRRTGSFEETIKCMRVLRRVGIKVHVMFTVTGKNYMDFIPLLDYLNALDLVDVIGFDKMIPEGRAKYREDILAPKEYRKFLYDVFLKIISSDYKFEISFKDNMWKLLFRELGLVDPFFDNEQVLTGCLVCSEAVAVLPNGNVLLCRRFNRTIGNINEMSISSIFERRNTYYFDRQKYEKCSECELWAFCRGCIADRVEVSEKGISEDIYCWKEV